MIIKTHPRLVKRRAAGTPDDFDIITKAQLLAAGWEEFELRQLPTSHGPAGAQYWPTSDLSPWLDVEHE
jgi:hypothetical protein